MVVIFRLRGNKKFEKVVGGFGFRFSIRVLGLLVRFFCGEVRVSY